ncbi:uncharacterized protein SCHCODRAFT_02750631 [Schizophyllum commune H4-8]|uniref:uncharacterized protein n=1 Tax=Schizophyllum commune (strain H4-8 / FGSC 9210) TaxID=578458 RepID=UPI002160155D|nr:uncharacterized protein SCHCODRAFT_02750631 [Schizophyllum commune H4-8]KAI5888994.1 hypothetical protein SCHCODRAFT_02750631 [Schizophyllum commune H4-8]
MMTTDISNDLEVFREAVKCAFQNRAACLPPYQPSTGSPSWQNFVASLNMPEYSEQPMLMLQTFRDVRNSDHLRAQLSRIFCQGQHKLLQNVSGSGKTSLVIEGLRHHWGFYFVGAVDSWGIGSNDISNTVDMLSGSSADRQQCEETRLDLLKIPLLIRLMAFEMFAETVDVSRATQEDRELWLLVQACSRNYFWPADEYAMLSSAMCNCGKYHVQTEIDNTLARIRKLTKDPDLHFYAVFDEAQALARSVPPFARGEPRTSFHREFTRSWENYPWLTLVMSGTAFLYDQYPLGDACSSPTYHLTSATGSSHRSRVVEYVKRYLPPALATTAPGQNLIHRASAWLHGRHRFSAAYIAFFLKHGPDAPHTLLDDFIKQMTGFKPVDAEQLVRDETTPLNYAEDCYLPLAIVDKHTPPVVRSTMHHVLYQFLVTGDCKKTFGRDRIVLIERSAGRFCDDNASRIIVDEPLCLLSAAQWFCESGHAQSADSFFAKGLIYNTDDPDMSSVREHIVLLLAHAFSKARLLADIFSASGPSHLRQRLKAELVEFHRSVEGGRTVFYPFSYARLSTSRPVVLATNCASHSDVLAWLRHEHTSPFCLLPDQRSLLFALRFSNGTFCWVVAQASSAPSDDLMQCFHPPASTQEDNSRIMSLLSQIPAPCDFLGSPPILRVTVPSPSGSLASDEPTLNMTYLESIASEIQQRDVLLRIVSNVIRVTEPYMPDASELLDPNPPPSPATKSRRKSTARSARTTLDKVLKPPEPITRYDLHPRRKVTPASTNPAVPITHSSVTKNL